MMVTAITAVIGSFLAGLAFGAMLVALGMTWASSQRVEASRPPRATHDFFDPNDPRN